MLDLSKLDMTTVYMLMATKPIIVSNKTYTNKVGKIDPKVMYMFKNEEEFKEYFYKNGVTDDNTINEVTKIVDSSGVILTYKLFCDTTIMYYKKIKDFEKKNTPKKILKYALVKQFENDFKKQD